MANTGIPAGAFVCSWRPQHSAILGVGALLVEDVAQLTLALLDRVLARPAGAEVDCQVLDHG